MQVYLGAQYSVYGLAPDVASAAGGDEWMEAEVRERKGRREVALAGWVALSTTTWTRVGWFRNLMA